MVNTLFEFCVLLMEQLAQLTGCSYKTINVYLLVYVLGVIYLGIFSVITYNTLLILYALTDIIDAAFLEATKQKSYCMLAWLLFTSWLLLHFVLDILPRLTRSTFYILNFFIYLATT